MRPQGAKKFFKKVTAFLLLLIRPIALALKTKNLDFAVR